MRNQNKKKYIYLNFQLQKKLKEKVLKLFSLIDEDDSKTIDRDDTLKFWSKNFLK